MSQQIPTNKTKKLHNATRANDTNDTNEDSKINNNQIDSESSSIMDEKVYEVEKIIGKKKVKGVQHYLVKWEGYSFGENTWEPEGNLLQARSEIKKFEVKLKKEKEKEEADSILNNTYNTFDNTTKSNTNNERSKRLLNNKRECDNSNEKVIEKLYANTEKKKKQYDSNGNSSRRINNGISNEVNTENRRRTLNVVKPNEKPNLNQVIDEDYYRTSYRKNKNKENKEIESKNKEEQESIETPGNIVSNSMCNSIINTCDDTDKDNLISYKSISINKEKELIRDNSLNYECGNFKEDIPKKILNAKILNKEDVEDDPKIKKNIRLLIEWEMRPDGMYPNPTYYSNNEIQEICPDLLIDYYESKLKTFNK